MRRTTTNNSPASLACAEEMDEIDQEWTYERMGFGDPDIWALPHVPQPSAPPLDFYEEYVEGQSPNPEWFVNDDMWEDPSTSSDDSLSTTESFSFSQ